MKTYQRSKLNHSPIYAKIAIFHEFIVDFEGGNSDLYMTITMGPAEAIIPLVTCNGPLLCNLTGEYSRYCCYWNGDKW